MDKDAGQRNRLRGQAGQLLLPTQLVHKYLLTTCLLLALPQRTVQTQSPVLHVFTNDGCPNLLMTLGWSLNCPVPHLPL